MAPIQEGNIKLRRLILKNFKIFDHLELDFPPPRMKDDPDVIVMGSKNGLGKTSVLEACAFLYLVARIGDKTASELFSLQSTFPLSLPDLFIRTGAAELEIESIFHCTEIPGFFGIDTPLNLVIMLDKAGRIQSGGANPIKKLLERADIPPSLPIRFYPPEILEKFNSIFGFSAEPFIDPPVLYFHSNRKVREGNPDIGSVLSISNYMNIIGQRKETQALSIFKSTIIRLLMSQADMFESVELRDSEKFPPDSLQKLNELVERYAGGKIEKLRQTSGSTIELRVKNSNGNGSISFDSLSSGQKEIISTLFLIWYYSRNNPCIVLIDEPELHLNAEWHRDFIKQAHTLAPENQYIIATHSEHVFGSVERDRRIMLEPIRSNKK